MTAPRQMHLGAFFFGAGHHLAAWRHPDWFTTGAADGFNVLAPTLPHGLREFAQLVVPELQRRGLFRTEYTGRTLREHLGLTRPAHPAAAAHPARELATT